MTYDTLIGIQMLHCRQFDPDVEGGDSTFIDAFAAAEDLRDISPESFDALVKIPATFKKVPMFAQREYAHAPC